MCPALVLMSRNPSCQFNKAAQTRQKKKRKQPGPGRIESRWVAHGAPKNHGVRAGPLRAEPGGPCANPFPDWHATSGPGEGGGRRITQAPSMEKGIRNHPPTGLKGV